MSALSFCLLRYEGGNTLSKMPNENAPTVGCERLIARLGVGGLYLMMYRLFYYV
jgi:hypothetical protein